MFVTAGAFSNNNLYLVGADVDSNCDVAGHRFCGFIQMNELNRVRPRRRRLIKLNRKLLSQCFFRSLHFTTMSEAFQMETTVDKQKTDILFF